MIGTYLQNRYRIEAELGQGGMGAIYRATDTLLQREVAVKMLSAAGLGTEGRARLLREAQAVAKLNHPNIVSLYDAGESDGVPFLVMELVMGDSLRERPPQSLEETLSITRQLCDALDHAHKNGVVHRDLKPENVLVLEDPHPQPLSLLGRGEQGVRVKLVDFGLARSGVMRVSVEGLFVGTVSYIAPEQALGQEVDARADLYALGVMLYELTANRLPFTADDPIAVISQHLYAPVVPPSTFNPEIPPALDTLIGRLMAKRPAERPTSASEVRRLLDTLAQPSTIALPNYPTTELSLLDRIVRGRLVGRQTELAQLLELWSHVQQDSHSHLVLISGEPGVGKTRLAHEVMVHAQLNGALVLRGGCYEFEATTPYMPLAEALRDWVSTQRPDDLRARLSSNAFELARLAPEIEVKIGPLPPNPPLPPNDERLRLFDHIARFLQKIAAERGLLLFVDDLHWADHGTLALLHYVLHRLRNDRLLVLAAYREIELDRSRPLADALIDWNRERLATRIPIGRLPPDGTCGMLCALLGLDTVTDEFAQLIHRETEGNPFFVEEVVKSLIEQGQLYREGDHWERKEIAELTVPQSVREAIGRRLNRLDKACIDVLHVAAALGKAFAFNELRAACALSEDQVLDALDDAEHAQLIRTTRGARTEEYLFTHDKIREVLYEEMNPIRRRRLHQRIGESLLKLYADDLGAHVADLAYHFAESGDLEKGLEFCARAAEKAESIFAHDEALGYIERAVACAESLNRPERIAALEQATGDIYYWRGPFEKAIEHYQHALTHTEAVAQRAALRTKIGATYAYVGDERGLSFLLAAEQELDPATQADDLARTLAMLGRYHHYRTETGRALDYLERARQLAEPLSQVRTLAEIYGYLAGACQGGGQFGCSDDWARQLVALGERENDGFAVAMGYEFLAENTYVRGDWQAGLDYAARAKEIGARIGSLARVAWAESAAMHAHHVHGDLAAALAVADRCVALAERIGDRRLTVQTRAERANIHCDLGDDEATQADLDVARAGALVINQQQAFNWAYGALIRTQVLRGEWEQVLTTADEMITRLNNNPIGFRIAAYFWLDRRDKLAQLAAKQTSHVDPNWTLRFQSDRWWGIGMVEALIGSRDRAREAYTRAVEIYGQLGMRLEQGRVLVYRALLKKEQGSEDAARADLLRARSLFEECGAARDLAKAQRLIDDRP